jgi:hypothetical protein
VLLGVQIFRYHIDSYKILFRQLFTLGHYRVWEVTMPVIVRSQTL